MLTLVPVVRRGTYLNHNAGAAGPQVSSPGRCPASPALARDNVGTGNVRTERRFYPKSILPKEAAVSKTHRLLIGAAVIAASLAPAASAFALAGTNHNELLLLDD